MRNLLGVLFVFVFVSLRVQAAENAPADWTFLTYLNGHNNLDDFGYTNINEMEQVGSTAKINVVVQWASNKEGNTKRIFVKKDNDTNNVTSPVIQNMGANVDMGDYKTLIDFIVWGAQHYPANHYFVNLWDHGSGWHAKGIRGGITRDVSWDENSGNHITTAQLGAALKEASKIIGHPIDVYGSDACLMAMPEVAGEMAGAVTVYAGSEDLEPGLGWPYQDLLKEWNSLASATPQDVGRILANVYVNSYSGGSHGSENVPFSAFDLSKFDVLNSAVAGLGNSLSNLPAAEKDKAIQAITDTKNFYYDDYRDLADFIDNLSKGGIRGISPQSLDDVKAAVKTFAFASKTTSGYGNANGLSLWLPPSRSDYDSYSSSYKTLWFDQQTKWGEAIGSIVK